ncbi:peptidoglycan D,D-transpeptidase FtsI family protein [Bifidobacterium favimelis]|uniref:Penicillin-binding protein 2 n=1 Tax=Bifidobacterium favimelis TaxID=3122979 RepID=A0ABU8ZNQ4_9BIFI
MTGNDSRTSLQRSFVRRTVVVSVVLALVALAALGKLAYIQLFQGGTVAQAATASRTVPHTLKAQRGKIVDTNGLVLAQSLERYTIIADPQAAAAYLPDSCISKSTGKDTCGCKTKSTGDCGAAGVAHLLAPILQMNPMELGGKLSVPGRYAVLAKDVTPEAKRAIGKLGLAGVISCELSSQRTYPRGDLMGAILGGLDAEGNGVNGIEQMENKRLTGKDGYEVYQQGRQGQQIPGTQTKSQEPVNGADVKLTIDQDVQWYVKKALDDARDKYHADWAVAVVQEVGTSRILALADTDDYRAGSDEAKIHPSKAVSQTFEPGSIGKTISVSGMLQEGVHKIDDRFTVPDHITVDRQQYKDSTNHKPEQWTLAGIVQNSSNVGMVMAGDGYPDQKRYEYLTKFGIGQKSGLGLPGESQGLLSQPGNWDRRTRNTVLFGQGYATNALQLTNAIATIGNKGVHQPQTIILGEDGEGQDRKPSRVVDAKVAAEVMNSMESVAEKYEKTAKVEGYRVAAKTGTAEVSDGSGGLGGIISDWSGILPADNPRFVVTVVVKNPHNGAGVYGGLVAGPIFAQIGEFLMQKYQVPVSPQRTDAIPVEW